MKYLQEFVDFFKNISHFGHKLEIGDIDHTSTNLQSLEDIKIPLFNVEINIYHAFKLLSKFFVFNNEVDDYITIIYDYDKRLIRESMLLNIGVGDSIIQDVITDAIPEDFTLEGEDSVVFQSVSKFIQDKYSIQIGRIKIVDAQFLEKLIQEVHTTEEGQNDNRYSQDILRKLLETFDQNHIRAYPEMPLLMGLKRIAEIFTNFSSNTSEILNNLENNHIPVTFFDEDWYVTFLKDGQTINISKPYEFGRITNKDHFQWINFMKQFKTVYSKKYGAKVSYFVDINWCIDFLSDVCESNFPLTKERLEYLMQRFLYFVKQIEELWDVFPRPISYNEYIRLLTRLLSGFHISPRKLSYWSIPSMVTHFLKENFGPSDQIVLLLTEKEKITGGLKLKMDKSALGEIVHIDKNDIEISTSNEKEIYNQVVSQFGFTKSIIYLDKSIFHKFMKFLIFDRNSRNPLRYISTLFFISKLNNRKIFKCYPELPWYIFFKKTGALRSFRLLNKLLYDFLEF